MAMFPIRHFAPERHRIPGSSQFGRGFGFSSLELSRNNSPQPLGSNPASTFPVAARTRQFRGFRSFEPERFDDELAQTGHSQEGGRT